MNNHINFRAYRYQLLPLDRNQTKDLFDNISPDEAIARKNEFFSAAISNLQNLKHQNLNIILQAKEICPDFFKIRIAPSRPLKRETYDFRVESIDNWPHVEAYILNAPDEQYLFLQDRASAFANTDTIVNLLKRGTRHALESNGLSLHVEALFNKKFFWDLVSENINKITQIRFEFITPNMANISRTLEKALKDLSKKTNSVREELTIISDPASSLDIDPSNETIQGLVDYTSAGGGDIVRTYANH